MMAEESKPDKEEKVVVVAKRPADVQRMKLEKLMKNPDKPVFIPEKREGKLPKVFNPPEFVRNIWGSSAGAGSGDFHVYRSVRRREYARQKFINEMAEQERLDLEYHEKMKEHEKMAELRTAKKRNKRLKKKQKQKVKKRKVTTDDKKQNDEENSSSSEDDSDEEKKTDKTEDGNGRNLD